MNAKELYEQTLKNREIIIQKAITEAVNSGQDRAKVGFEIPLELVTRLSSSGFKVSGYQGLISWEQK